MATSRTFVRDFISIARKANESDEFPLEFFQAPCQVIVLFVKSHNLMLTIAKHEPRLKDLEVDYYVVDSLLQARAMVDKKVLTDSYWIEQSLVVEVAGIVASILNNRFARMVKRLPEKFTAWRIKVTRNDGCMISLIDKEKDTPNDLLMRVVKSIKKRHRHERKHEKREEEAIYVCSAFWYPPFVFKDQPVTLAPRFVMDTRYKDYRIMFDNKSHISVLSPIKPPLMSFDDKALEIFNEIIGTANLYNIDGTTVSSDELVWFEFSKDLKQSYSVVRKPTPSIRSVIFEEYTEDPAAIYKFSRYCPFNYLTKSAVEDVVRKAEVITQNDEMRNYISLFFDAKTHFLTRQDKSAFLLAWLVVEKYIDGLWSETLSSKGISGKRYSKLAKSILWTIDDELETLNIIGQISDQRYFQINRLKGVRNAVIHRERKVRPKEAEECVKLSKDIVREVIRDRCFVE